MDWRTTVESLGPHSPIRDRSDYSPLIRRVHDAARGAWLDSSTHLGVKVVLE